MPLTVLVVHNETDTRELALTALRAAGYEPSGFDDPMTALAAIDGDAPVHALVTRMDFGEGKLNGVALALMSKLKRPGIKVVFVARYANQSHADEVGDFLPVPLDTQALVTTVGRLLAEAAAPFTTAPPVIPTAASLPTPTPTAGDK